MKTRTAVRILGCALVLAGAPVLAQSQIFSPGAIIIPENANFQTTCGAAGAYGLVWQILLSNAPGGYNATHPVTVYLVVNNSKGSPDRCVPSNKNTNPQGGAWNVNPTWNDGCDIHIVGTTDAGVGDQPVTMVPVPAAGTAALPSPPTGGIYADTAIQMFSPGSAIQIPTINSVTLNNAGCPGACAWTDVQYQGGPFVIDAPDVPNVIGFLQNAISSGNTNVSQFVTQCTAANQCSPSASYASLPDGVCHYVYMHQAKVSFTANVAARFSQAPPKIALVDAQDSANTPGPSAFGTQIDTGILDNYLSYAGMNFTGAGGCPPASMRPASAAACNLNGGARGTIYERLYANADLISTTAAPNGVLNAQDPLTGGPMYGVLWTPHWVGGTSSYPEYNGSETGTYKQIANVLDNISTFVHKPGNGLMGECASIGTYQGINGTPGRNYYGAVGESPSPVYTTSTQFLVNGPVNANQASLGTVDSRNCTDPNMSGSGNCSVFPYPANPIAQMGDFHFYTCDPSVIEDISSPDGGFASGALRLAVTNIGLQASSSPPAVSGEAGWDLFDTIAVADGGTVVFMGGHNWSGGGSVPCPTQSMGAVRVILNSLLELGFTPTGPERALSAPTVFDPGDGGILLVSGTYNAISYPPATPPAYSFLYDNGSQWVFPTLPGHLRATPLVGGTALTVGESGFSTDQLWDANNALQATPPGSRNLFTYFGGIVNTWSGPNGVGQTGWQPEIVSGNAGPNTCSAGTQSGCVDVVGLTRGSGPNFFPTLTLGADGICDIYESASVFTSSLLNGGNDYSGHCNAHDIKVILNELPKAQAMLQHVRGYCFASLPTNVDGPYSASTNYPNLTPTNIQCNKLNAPNYATLGGIAHSSAAVIPASPNIPDKCSSGVSCRPTVAYVGGLDGELHAFYLGDNSGKGYAGPLAGRGADAGIHYPNPSANSARPSGATPANVFSNDFSTVFSGGGAPDAGTELWAFVPPSQLPGLKENNARVDSSPTVMDVFVDMLGTGIREWHTVLVSGIGPTGNEVFAMDITDPLNPVLLWDVISSELPWGVNDPIYTPAQLTTAAANLSNGSITAYKWLEPTAYFSLLGTDPGRQNLDIYDYTDLGAASHVSIGQLRQGLEPVYAAFVATNNSGGISSTTGEIDLFAIDIATGRILWEWHEPYSHGLGANNGVPPVASLMPGSDGSVSRILIGDQEGYLWEIDANTGINVNNDNSDPVAANCPTLPCNFPAFYDGSDGGTPQPISTNVAMARVPTGLPPSQDFTNFPGATVLVFGTAGEDWVPITGGSQLYVLPWDAKYRTPITSNLVVTNDETHGVLQNPNSPILDIGYAAPTRIYANISASGNSLLYSTAAGIIGNDLSKVVGNTAGTTYQINMSTATGTNPATSFATSTLANYGGLGVFHNSSNGNDYVVGLEVGKISVMQVSGATPNPQQSMSQKGILYQLLFWFSRFL